MGTFNTAILPATPGLDLGRTGQEWDIFVRDLTVSGNVSGAVFPTGNGNAIAIRGIPVTTSLPADQQVLAYDAGTNTYVWVNQTGGGGGGTTFGYVNTAFSATPTFTPSPVGSCTFKITLTGAVTSSTISTAGATAGALFFFIIVQDATGGRAFNWPSNVLGGIQIDAFARANTTYTQNFVFDGTSLYSLAPGAIYP